MCDTFVVMSARTADGSVLFGKNSDRDPNEAQALEWLPAADHGTGSALNCTYIEIPQADHTHSVLLSRPFWMWGAEMGANEHGVVIGNEAVFTKVPYQKKGGLTGMDLLRLGLERGGTAFEALRVITSLLEKYGQGGNCGLTHEFVYHNSFMLADPAEAWVLETAGPHWAAKKVVGFYAISNRLTIGSEWDLASQNLVQHAVEMKWCRGESDFDFARCYSDFLYTKMSAAAERRACSTAMAVERSGSASVETAMAILRAHGVDEDAGWRQDAPITGSQVCMHAGFGPVRESQSVGSFIAHLTPDRPTYWATATSGPCTSLFKPVWLDSGLEMDEPALGAKYDPACRWWRHERLHRAVLADLPRRLGTYRLERDEVEKRFLNSAKEVGIDREARRQFTRNCFTEADALESGWTERVARQAVERKNVWYYQGAWRKWNHAAQMPD
jgi:secernin